MGWLLAVGRSTGQEWHFDGDARNRASAWLAYQRIASSGEIFFPVRTVKYLLWKIMG